MTTLNVTDLIKMRSWIDTLIANGGGDVSSLKTTEFKNKPAKASKSKAEKPKAERAPGWIAAYTAEILAQPSLAAEKKAFVDASETKQGAHLKWLSQYKKEHVAEMEAFKAKWTAEHPKSATASVAGDSEPEAVTEVVADSKPAGDKPAKRRGPKKLEDMTPEELATHNAKKAEKKAKKEAEKTAVEKVAIAKEAAPAPKQAPVATPVCETTDDGEAELLPFDTDGVSYMRLGVKSADGAVAWYTGDLWDRKADGSRGDYIGALTEDGSIDGDAVEPKLE